MTALVHEKTAELMRCVPGIDEIEVLPVGADWQGGGELVRMIWRLREQEFDAAVDFSSPAYKWIGALCDIPLRTYMKFDPNWWFSAGDHARWRTTHATEHYYDCARELGLPPWDEVDHRLRLQLPRSAREEAQAFLHASVGHYGGPLIAMHAGGSMLDGVKRWPADRFAELAEALCTSWHARVLLLGGPEDVELANAIAGAMRGPAVVAAGTASLVISLALVESADLLIGNDSGLLHAAAALGTPYIGIYGPTAPSNFHPIESYPGQGHVVLPPVPCPEPGYFVGGDVIWRHRRCHGTCAALLTLPVSTVLAYATIVLQARVSAAGAV
jgi:ADP-heptose:LPS heptosyltransferase